MTVISLDSLAGQHVRGGDKIAFIKIDVDGSEPELLARGAETIRRHRPINFMEFAPSLLSRGGKDPSRLYQQLCEWGHVYWASERLGHVRRVKPNDYDALVNEVADRVTNLMLSSFPLKDLDSFRIEELLYGAVWETKAMEPLGIRR